MSDKYAPDSLKYQWRIIGLVLRSGWATSLDKSIAFEIVDNYRKDHGNSRASLSYLVNATGADRKSVIASTRRLVENGPFSIARQGSGTRPTEYNINFDLVAEKPSSGADTTSSNDQSSSGVGTTTGGGVDTTTSAHSSGADTTESVLPYAAYKADIRDRTIDCAPASPPPAVGLKATAAGRSQGGFEELWKTYFPQRGQGDKKKARSAYEALAPDADLHASLLDSARAWFEAWQAQGKIDAPRKHLDTWLTGEHYDCEPPTAYKSKEKTSSKKPAKASNDNEPAETGIPARASVDRVVKIVQSEVQKDEDDDSSWLYLQFEDENGTIEPFAICLNSDDQGVQDRGQARLQRLVIALGINGINQPSDVIGIPLMLTAKDDFKPLEAA